MPDELDGLRALAGGLCQTAGLTLVKTSGPGWTYNPRLHRIGVPPDALERGPRYAAGLLAHEVGHAEISRLHRLRPALCGEPLLEVLALLMEERRVNAFIAARYPGAGSWLAEVASHDRSRGAGGRADPVDDFARHLILSAWADDVPDPAVHPEVRTLLEETAEARCRHALLWPEEPAEANAALFEGAVAPYLTGPPPTRPAERATLRAALAALRLVQAEILPRVEARLGQERCDRLRASLFGRSDAARRWLSAWAETISTLARHAADRLLHEAPSPASVPAADQPSLGRLRVPLPRPPVGEPTDPSPYARIRGEMRGQIKHLTDAFVGLFRARQRLGERVGCARGTRPDLRRLMRWEADPARADPRIWRRPTIPARSEAAFSLLVDLSGSMKGPKIDAALRATVVLVETLAALDLATEVNGFQDRLIPLLGFGETLGAATRQRLGEMPLEVRGKRPRGNNQPLVNDDGVALADAARRLAAEPSQRRLLIVLCDGLPEAPGDAEARLRAAIQAVTASRVIDLIGLGLGRQTGHVRDYYPDHAAEIPVESFARVFAGLLRRRLGALIDGTGGTLDRA